ncbi:Hypothetical protein NTJ_09866 [Nesidiocoris tenuis]|nr:Hypothetical protein NTJ_09866 [Nesidiocoris tenuis]
MLERAPIPMKRQFPRRELAVSSTSETELGIDNGPTEMVDGLETGRKGGRKYGNHTKPRACGSFSPAPPVTSHYVQSRWGINRLYGTDSK